MSKHLKINTKSALGIAVGACLLILTFYAHAMNGHPRLFAGVAIVADTVPLVKKPDTIFNTVSKKDTLIRLKTGDSLSLKNDSLVPRVDSFQLSPDSLDAVVKSHADDSAVVIVPSNQLYLYGKAKTEYKDLGLVAATIHYNNETSIVSAYGSTDTTGSIGSKPEATQGDIKTISDTIMINVKTGKGRTQNTFLQQGEVYLYARVIKNVSKDVAFARYARFTTCNLDTPHFAFLTPRMKIVSNTIGVTGRVYPEIESVPIPMVFLPFGIFPLNTQRHSGVLLPSFASSEDFGLGLENFGYYKTFGQHADATFRGTLYSYGGWSASVNTKYIQRYKYTGNFNLSFQSTRLLNRGISTDEEFSTTKSYMINWTHSRDTRARPGTSFSANVNFGSTRFNQTQVYNPLVNFNNVLTSSINYTKDFNGKFNLSMNINHSSNSRDRLVQLSLPTFNLNMITMYPFQKADRVGTGKWYEKIGIGYSGNFINQVAFYDTAFSFRRLLDTVQYGAQHSIPITLSLPSLGPITLAPSVSFEERWYGQKVLAKWDTSKGKIDTVMQRGFYTARQMSFGMGVSTRVFGTYTFGPKSNVIAIRHEVRPTFSIAYQPGFNARNYYDLQVDSAGHKVRVSQYSRNVIGAFGEGSFGGISFGLDNILEMKVKDKAGDSVNGKPATKKVKLIEGFGFTSSYNLLADSLRLADFNFYARTTLFERLNISAGANVTPYQVDSFGQKINKFIFDPKRLKFGRLTNANIAVSTSFSSGSKDGKDDKTRQIPVDPFMTPDEQQRQLQYARANPAEFTDFNIPWTLSLSYSLSFSRILRADYKGFTTETNSGLTFNGDFSLTPKWKVGATGSYDVTHASLQQLSAFITREMHCWQLSINVNPVGLYRSFNISFSPKSGLLRDFKINRTRSFVSDNF